MQEHPVGTGPYKLVSWQRKQEHLLVRNDDYWGPKPYYKYVRIRIIPEQATQIAELLSGGVDIIKAVPPDQMDVINKSGPARTGDLPILRTAIHPARSGRARRSEPVHRTSASGSAANLAADHGRHHQARAQRPRRPRRHRRQPDGLRLGPESQALQAGHRPRQEAPRRGRLPERRGHRVQRGAARPSSPASQPDQRRHRRPTSTKAGFRVKRNYIGDNTVQRGPRSRKASSGPMFDWSWGYYSVFDADAILYDIFKCGEFYAYYCNKALDDLDRPGRSTLDQKKRTEIYAKAQKLLFDDAAYLYKWGLRGVWGISNRVDYDGAAGRGRPDVPRDSAKEVGGQSDPRRAPRAPEARPPAFVRCDATRSASSSSSSSSSSASRCSPSPSSTSSATRSPSCCPQNAGKEEYARATSTCCGLDQPVYVQYWKFASRAVQRRLRQVVVRQRPAFQLVVEPHAADHLPHPRRPRRGAPHRAAPGHPRRPQAPLASWTPSARSLAVAGQAMPIFWLGIMLIIIFAVRLRLLPASGLRHLAELRHAAPSAWAPSSPRSPCASCAPASSRS